MFSEAKTENFVNLPKIIFYNITENYFLQFFYNIAEKDLNAASFPNFKTQKTKARFLTLKIAPSFSNLYFNS